MIPVKAGEHSSPLRSVSYLSVGAICDLPLGGGFQHILDKNSISPRRIVYKDMGHGAHQFSVLDNR